MKITGDWIRTPATQTVLRLLEEAGHQALFVGGCVRNALLDAPVKDIDIATDAHPETVIALAKANGLKAIPTGIDHGTVTVVSDHIPHEITTFRKDVESDGRHAIVAYSSDLTEDARRRDFTMNALYATRQGDVIDPLGGLSDVQARRVRFIEDAGERIREDYLRILRFFRFHAWYGDAEAGMDAEALGAIAAHLDGLQTLSRERVGAEITRLLAAPDPAPAVAAMRHAGVLQAVMPGAEDRALAHLVHLEAEAGAAPDAIRRLAALGGEDVAERLRLSKVEARQLATLRAEIGSMASPLALAYHHDEQIGLSVLLLRAALFETPLEPKDRQALSKGASAAFPVTGADLMENFEGPALGRELQRLEAEWLSSDCSLTREQLLSAGRDHA